MSTKKANGVDYSTKFKSQHDFLLTRFVDTLC